MNSNFKIHDKIQFYRISNQILKSIKFISVCFLIFTCCFIFLTSGCKENISKEGHIALVYEEGKVNPISVDDVYNIVSINDSSYYILDVRTKEEFSQGHINGAKLIPVSELEGRLGELPKDKPIIIYCRTGGRSLKAATILVDNGFKAVFNMEDGIVDWKNKGYPVVKE
jgi:rhodanese-related sulfurtransferase